MSDMCPIKGCEKPVQMWMSFCEEHHKEYCID